MARFVGSVGTVTPLQMQLKSVTTTAKVCVVRASGDNSTGSASRPALSRPSTIGTASTTQTPVTMEPQGGASGCELGTAFSAAPTAPTISSHSANLPMRFSWIAPPGYEFIIGMSGAGYLYATASGGHTWSARLEWEEP